MYERFHKNQYFVNLFGHVDIVFVKTLLSKLDAEQKFHQNLTYCLQFSHHSYKNLGMGVALNCLHRVILYGIRALVIFSC